jgi:phosphate transport system ATP-binding protein
MTPDEPLGPIAVPAPPTPGTEVVLEVDHFNLYYGANKALMDISMSMGARQVTALIGPSGCGKSTLLRSLNRLNDLVEGVRTEGDIRLLGSSVYRKGVDVIALRKRMSMVFQKQNPFPKSIYENVVFGLRVDGEKRKQVLDEAVERCLRQSALWDEVKDRVHKSALDLSGGQQQRLCIARAIATRPEVLLMDEPCSALDPIATSRIEDLIIDLKKDYTVVIVTHNMQQAARVADVTAFMYLGRLIEVGETTQVFERPRMTETEAYITGRYG